MQEQKITVSGRNMDVGDAMTEYVEAQMTALGQKYFGRLVGCRVVFTKLTKGHSYTCNIGIQVGRDMHYEGEAQYDNVRTCFTQAYEHVAKQLRRHKRAMREDKPTGPGKEWVLNELSRPDSDPSDAIPMLRIDGEQLSVDDAREHDSAKVVEKLYAPK